MLHSIRGETVEMEKELRQLDGADLQWWSLTTSMASLGLKVLGLTADPAFLFFSGPNYIDMPLVMHDVRVRVATPSSLEALRERLQSEPGFFPEYLERMSWQEVVHITCTEGDYFIWTDHAEIHVGAIPSLESLEWVKENMRYPGVDPTSEDFWRVEHE